MIKPAVADSGLLVASQLGEIGVLGRDFFGGSDCESRKWSRSTARHWPGLSCQRSPCLMLQTIQASFDNENNSVALSKPTHFQNATFIHFCADTFFGRTIDVLCLSTMSIEAKNFDHILAKVKKLK